MKAACVTFLKSIVAGAIVFSMALAIPSARAQERADGIPQTSEPAGQPRPAITIPPIHDIRARVGMPLPPTPAPKVGGAPVLPLRFSASGLPKGMAIDPATGAISGKAIVVGTFLVAVTAEDSARPDAGTATTAPFRIVVEKPMTATAPADLSGRIGSQVTSGPPTASGNPIAPLTWMLHTGSLPKGMSVNPATGAVSGTPAVAGSYRVTLELEDATGTNAYTETMSVDIAAAAPALPGPETRPAGAAPPMAGLARGIPNLAEAAAAADVGEVSVSIPSVMNAGNATGASYAIRTGTLPPGLTLDPSTGLIHGAISANYAPATVSVTAAGANGVSVPAALTLTQTAGVLTPTTAWCATNLVTAPSGAQQGTKVPVATYYDSDEDTKCETIGTGYTVAEVDFPVPVRANSAYTNHSAVSERLWQYWDGSQWRTYSGVVEAQYFRILSYSTKYSDVETWIVSDTPTKAHAYWPSLNAATQDANIGQAVNISIPDAMSADSATDAIYAIASGTLPRGLSFTPEAGLISGTPAGGYGSAALSVTATTARGASVPKTLTLAQTSSFNPPTAAWCANNLQSVPPGLLDRSNSTAVPVATYYDSDRDTKCATSGRGYTAAQVDFAAPVKANLGYTERLAYGEYAWQYWDGAQWQKFAGDVVSRSFRILSYSASYSDVETWIIADAPNSPNNTMPSLTPATQGADIGQKVRINIKDVMSPKNAAKATYAIASGFLPDGLTMSSTGLVTGSVTGSYGPTTAYVTAKTSTGTSVPQPLVMLQTAGPVTPSSAWCATALSSEPTGLHAGSQVAPATYHDDDGGTKCASPSGGYTVAEIDFPVVVQASDVNWYATNGASVQYWDGSAWQALAEGAKSQYFRAVAVAEGYSDVETFIVAQGKERLRDYMPSLAPATQEADIGTVDFRVPDAMAATNAENATYAIASGSLVAGLSMSSSGRVTGTVAGQYGATTVYVTATTARGRSVPQPLRLSQTAEKVSPSAAYCATGLKSDESGPQAGTRVPVATYYDTSASTKCASPKGYTIAEIDFPVTVLATNYNWYAINGIAAQYWNGTTWQNLDGNSVSRFFRVVSYDRFDYSDVETLIVARNSANHYNYMPSLTAANVTAARGKAFAPVSLGSAMQASDLGASPAYTFTGKLPAGMTIGGDMLSGTPTATGVYAVEVAVTNGAGESSVPQTLTVTVH